MSEGETEVYRIYQCPRCTHFTWDYKGTQMGWCSVSKKAVMNFPEYNLSNAAPNCEDWGKGKAKNK